MTHFQVNYTFVVIEQSFSNLTFNKKYKHFYTLKNSIYMPYLTKKTYLYYKKVHFANLLICA